MFTLEPFNLRTRENLPGDLGETITHVGKGGVKSELPVRKCLMAPTASARGRAPYCGRGTSGLPVVRK
jgi:hypothetical protein